MLHLLTRMVVALITLITASGGSVDTALSTIVDAANERTWPERGERNEIGEPDRPDTTPYGLPVADGDRAGWSDTHASYPATDVFAGCGAELVSPVRGTVLEVRRVDSYDPAVDNPATRGGRSVSILGYDGVRYYLAHLADVAADLAPGDEVALGQRLGTMGDTGRASACHLHFSISPPCPGKEWTIRRGVVWPYPYLAAWRRGEQHSPVDEVDAWAAANPNACAEAMADPYAPDS